MWKLTALAPMHVAGGRLFVDVTRRLASPADRVGLLDVMGRSDPLTRDALQTVLDRGDLITPLPDDTPAGPPPAARPPRSTTDPAIVTDLVARAEASIAALEREIGTRSGSALFDLILEDLPEMRRIMFDPQSQQAIMAGMEATWWLNDQLQDWLGEKNAADTLTQSAPHNVTSQMGLALLDVADVIRPHPDVVAFLRDVDDDEFLDGDALAKLDGGPDARDAIRAYLDTYGDALRRRDRHHPAALERAPHRARAGDPRQRQEPSSRARPSGASSGGSRTRRRTSGRCWSDCERCRMASRRPTRRSG